MPPHDSPPALRSVTPESVAEVRTGKELDGVATPAASAPDSVMILKVEPGGCGAETASPASASTDPSRGRTTATPPSLLAERRCGGALQPGADGGVHRVPPVALDRGDDAVAEAQLGPGRAGQARVVEALETGPAVAARGRAPGERGRRRVGREQAAVGARGSGRGSDG